MAAERDFSGDKGLEIVVVVVGGAAAPFGIGGRSGVLRGTRGRLGRLLRENIVEGRIQRLLHLGAGAEIAVHPLFLAGLKAVARGAAGHIRRMLGAGIVAKTAGMTGIGKFGPLFSPLLGGFARDRRL